MLGGAGFGLLIGNIMNSRWKVDAKKLHWFIVSLMLHLLRGNASRCVRPFESGHSITPDFASSSYGCLLELLLSRYGGILLAVSGTSEKVER
jgi:hypothetical protein